MNLPQLLQRALAPLDRKLRSLAARVTLIRTDDAQAVQRVQLHALADERLSNVQRLQQFGSSGHAPAGSTGLMICLGGARSQALLIALDDPKTRPQGLAEGEYQIYNAFGDFVRLKKDGTMEAVSSREVRVTSPLVKVVASTKVLLETPLVECSQSLLVNGNFTALGSVTFGAAGSPPVVATLNGSLNATGQISDAGGSMQEMRGFYNGHGHPNGGVPAPQMT